MGGWFFGVAAREVGAGSGMSSFWFRECCVGGVVRGISVVSVG
jgi:hypothetical protein